MPLTGASTFLFTDIEGSTEKWEHEAARMAQAVARHDELIRTAVEAHRGRVVKSTGDGIHAVFADPLDGIRAVIDIQTVLGDPSATAGIPLAVRCGLHSGEAEVRDNDFFGHTLNRAARIMGAAYGGQALVSHSVAALITDRLPAEISLRDLGGLRLKGLSTPERVYQLIHPRLRAEFPPLRSLQATPNNFPQQLTSFIGRERELMEAEALLAGTRLLTLLGMGGLGKTRLSLQMGGDLMDRFDDGAWFVDLAPIRDSSLVTNEVAKVLGVREEPGRALIETICAHLKPRTTLLIFDNCEQVIGASAHLANTILTTAPDVRIIATSRQALCVPGEQTYAVLPLPVPNRDDGIDALSKSTAVQLFLERAQVHQPGFALTERDAPVVAELVARLEGIPLALELAAARLRSLPVAEISARLKDRYKLLTGGGRVLLPRQQTLRALVDWSYDLLREDERVALDRLSIFAGGFDLAAAEAVCGANPLVAEDILDMLASLVDKSLVMLEVQEDRARYRMLETVRDYAREKLEQRGEATASAVRHCEHYFVMAKAANRGLKTGQQAAWTRRMETELDNVRAAIALALAGRVDPFIAVKIAVALQGFWTQRGYLSEGRRYVRAALALPAVQASDLALGHALYVGAALADCQGDHDEARRMLEKCLVLRRGLENPFDIAATLSTLSHARMHAGEAREARGPEEEALQIFLQLGDRYGEAISRLHLGQIAASVGEDAEAGRCLDQSLVIAREIKNQEIESECERIIGEVALERGNFAEASNRLNRALAVCHDTGDRGGEATALWWLGKTDIAEGNVDPARIKLGGSLRAFQSLEMRSELVGCLEDHASLALLAGAPDDAVRLCGAATRSRERLGLVRLPRAEARRQSELGMMRELLGDAAFNVAWSQGQAWEIDDAVRHALGATGQQAVVD